MSAESKESYENILERYCSLGWMISAWQMTLAGDHPEQGYATRPPSLVLTLKSTKLWGFLGGAVVENLPANAGDMGLSPRLGGSHMPWSNWACEPQLLSLRVWSLCSATREAAIVRGPCTAMKSGPHLLQPEKALAQK